MLGGILACVFLLAGPLWAQEIALTSDSYDHWYPQWSPVGNWIVYMKDDATGYSQICKVPSAGGEETALTSDSYEHRLPQWSQDGNWIVYMKDDATGYSQIYKVPSAGGEEIALTSDSYSHYRPQWSQDGNWIVYMKDDATGYSQIYKVPSAGGEETALTSDSYSNHHHPQWSPDGNWIVYYKWDAYYQIYKVSSEVGIEESETVNRQEAIGISVYPNPFTTVVSVKCSGISDNQKISLRVYDLSGRIVRSFPLTTDHYTLAPDFSPGIYFLKAEGYKPVKVIKLR